MPARKPLDANEDHSQAPAGAVEDATETQAAERQRRSRNSRPEQGDKKPAHLRGQVTKIQGALVEVRGSFVNPSTGEAFDEPSDWRVRPPRHQADQVKKYLKEGDEIQTTGLWLPTQESWDGEQINNALQAFEISRPLDAAPSLAVAPEISGGAAGGVGLG